MTNNPPIRVDIAQPVIKKLKKLLKKYPHVVQELQGLIQRLEQGETPGDQIKGVKYTTYKVRVKNSDASKGKSGGYRVVYYIRTETHVIVVMIYSKTDQADVEPDEIRQIIDNLNL